MLKIYLFLLTLTYSVLASYGWDPRAPMNLQLKLLQGDPPKVSVTWRRPIEVFGYLAEYLVVFRRKGSSDQTFKNISPKSNVYVTGALDRGTTYEFEVIAISEYGFSPAASKTITTPE